MSGQCPEERYPKSLRIGIETLLFLLVLAIFPLTDDPAGDIKDLILCVGAFLLSVVWITGSWRTGATFRRPPLFAEILAIWFLLSLVSGLTSGFVPNSLATIGEFGALLLVYAAASQAYRSPSEIRRMMLVFCIAVALAALYAIFIQKTGLDPFPWSNRESDVYTNLPATFGNPNYAAHTLILAVIMAIYLTSGRKALLYLGFAALFLVHLRFTQQRGGLVALAAALTLIVVAKMVSLRVRRPVRAVVATLLLTGLLAIMGAASLMAMNKIRNGTPYPLDLSLLIRYKSYVSASSMILKAPVLGYGPGNYKIAYPPFWTPYEQKWFAQETKMNAHVHNDLIEAAIDAGLPAAGLYLAFLVLGMAYGLYLAFSDSDRSRRRLGYMFSAFCCAFFVDGFFGFNLHVPVSATILFAMAGAFEGFWSASYAPPNPPRWKWSPFFARAAVFFLALGVFGMGVCTFIAHMLYQRGMAEFYAGQVNVAGTFWTWGERFAPWDWQFGRQRGIACAYQERWDPAVQNLERSLKRNPNYILTLTVAAQTKLNQGMAQLTTPPTGPGENGDDAQTPALQAFQEGAAYAQRALTLCPTYAPAEDLLGRLAVARGTTLSKRGVTSDTAESVNVVWREAENHFLRAIQDGSRNASDVYRQLAQVRISLGDKEGAEEAYVCATQADPNDDTIWPVFYTFARELRRYDRFKTALAWRIKRLDQQSSSNEDNLALAYLWLGSIEQDGYGNLEEAETAYRNAVHAAPMRPDVWSTYARFAQSTGRTDSFKIFLIETNSRLLTEGKQPLPHVSAIASVWKRGPQALVEASTVLVAVVQGKMPVPGKQPIDLDMGWAMGYLLTETAQAPIAPADTAVVLLHLGMVMAAIQDLEAANRAFPSAMPNLPPELQGVCAQHWADVLLRLKRPHEAINLLRDAKSRMPNDVDVRHALARSLIMCGKREEAKAEYETLLQLPALKEEDRKRIQGEMQEVLSP